MKKLISIFCALAIIVSVIFAVPTIVGAETQSDQWTAIQATYSGNISKYETTLCDTTNVLFDTLGENLITDPTVAAFDSNGDYLEYYDWETRDSSAVVNKNAWWDKPSIKYNGFDIDPLNPYYASPSYCEYTLKDPTLSHTADGSGVLKADYTDTSSAGFLPLQKMESYSYYAITFFTKRTGNPTWDRNGGSLSLKSAAEGTDAVTLKSFNFVTLSQLHSGWIRCTFIVYTGNNAWSEPVIVIPGGSGMVCYYDDFGMYKLDAAYGASCLDAGYMLPTTAHENTDVFPAARQAACLSFFKSGTYNKAYEDIDWSNYGVNICPDSTVSRFNGDVYSTYYQNIADGSVVDALAIWDKPAMKYNASVGATLYYSPNDRGFVKKDTSYSHTADGSGAIYAPNTESGAGQKFTIPMPTLEKYGYYVISFWVKGPSLDFENITWTHYATSNVISAKFNFGTAKQQSGKDWQRVTFLVYTGSSNISQNYIEFHQIHNITVDDIEVWKLNDESFAVDCLAEKRLVKYGDIDGDLAIDFTDVKSLRDDFLSGSLESSVITDLNSDGNVDICDYVSLNDYAMKENTYYQYANTAMLNTSLSLYQGDTNRFAYKLKQAKAGNPTKIAVLGDSITEGAGVSNMSMHYSTKFINWWSENVSSSVELVRRGSGGTTSYFGVHWAIEEILPENPDIVFIEYVNDIDHTLYLNAMDSLVRRCLELESKPAVVLLEMSYYGVKGEGVLSNAQNTHLQVAEAYGVPMISWRDAVEVAINSGLYKWTDLSIDEVHPNPRGNGLLAEMMVNFASKQIAGCASATEPDVFNTAAVTNDVYKTAKILNRINHTPYDVGAFTETVSGKGLSNGWGTTTGGEITFKVTAKRIGIAVLRSDDGLNGSADIYIDGNLVVTMTGRQSYLGIDARELKVFDTLSEHTVTIKVNAVNGADNYNVLGLFVAE